METRQAISDLFDLIRDRFENPNDTAATFVQKFNALKAAALGDYGYDPDFDNAVQTVVVENPTLPGDEVLA